MWRGMTPLGRYFASSRFGVMGFGEFGHAPEIGVAPFHSAENAVEGMERADDAVVQQNQFVIVVERR